jgi:pimeloyl-ACP methyl ester carboxylesterase
VIPRFFGEPERALFGAYHPPEGRSDRRRGVLLCYPAPEEYRAVHWAYQRLATMLSGAGFHVLRFDYFGTGDSAGETGAGDLEQWTSDIATAACELQEVGAIERISLVGFRLGAPLALGACAAGLRVRELVLWEPVLSGRAYLAQLAAEQERALREVRFPVDVRREPDELLGYHMSESMRRGIEQVDLLTQPLGVADRTFIVTAEERPEATALCARVTENGGRCACRVVPEVALYSEAHRQSETLLAHDTLDTIVSLLVEPPQ